MRPTAQRAYTENYPPLRDFLRENECRCDWQVGVGGSKEDPSAFIECYTRKRGEPSFMVLVYAEGKGWDVFTRAGGENNNVHAALDAVKAACFTR